MKTWAEITSDPQYSTLTPQEHDELVSTFKERARTQLTPQEYPEFEAKFAEKLKTEKPVTSNTGDTVTIVDTKNFGVPETDIRGNVLYYNKDGVYRDDNGKIISEGAPPTPQQYQPKYEAPLESSIAEDPIVSAVMAATTGGLSAAKAGMKGLPLVKEVAKEAAFGVPSAITGGASDIARLGANIATTGVKKIAGQPFKVKLPEEIPSSSIENISREIPEEISKVKPIIKQPSAQEYRTNWELMKQDATESLQREMSGTTKAESVAGGSESLAGDAKIFRDAFKDAEKQTKGLGGIKLSELKRTLPTKIWDSSYNVKAELEAVPIDGHKAVTKFNIMAGSSEKANYIGNKWSNEVYGGVKPELRSELDAMINAKRHVGIDIYKPEYKHMAKDVNNSKAFLMEQKQNIPANEWNGMQNASNKYFDKMREVLFIREKAGLSTAEDTKRLLAKGGYSPIEFIHHIDPITTGPTGLQAHSSGLKALTGGAEKAVVTDSEFLLREVIARTDAQIARNEARKGLWNVAVNNPDLEWLKVAKYQPLSKSTELGPIGSGGWTTATGMPYSKPSIDLSKISKPPDGYDTVSVMVKGQKHDMWMRSDLAKEFESVPSEVSPAFTKFLRAFSAKGIVQASATGALNPEFAMRNIFRDMQAIWKNTTEYSSVGPIALGQQIKDMISVGKDAIFKTGRYEDYIMQGGGQETLSLMGSLLKKINGRYGHYSVIDKTIRPLHDAVIKINEISENITRLALRERAIKNMVKKNNGVLTPEIEEEATAIARGYIDFHQGGSLAKVINEGMPYFNAGIQGTRGFVRAAKNNPALMAFKQAQLMTVSSGLMYAGWIAFPEVMSQQSNSDLQNNFIFPLGGLSYIDEKGDRIYRTIKIPKDQDQRLFCSISDWFTMKSIGVNKPASYMLKGASQAIPLNPGQSMMPAQSALYTYISGVDTFRGQKVWPGKDVNPQDEYHPKTTNPAFIKFGEVTGMSPERTRAALSKVFTYGNIYTEAMGYSIRLMMQGMDSKSIDVINNQFSNNPPFVRSFIGKGNPRNVEQDYVESMTRDENSRKQNLSREIDKFVESNPGKLSDQFEPWAKNLRPEDQKWAIDNYTTKLKSQDVQDKDWYLRIKNVPDEPRAKMFYEKYQKASDTEKEKMLGNIKLFNMGTKPFLMYLDDISGNKFSRGER
jgi:hypothetical protein